MNDNLLRELQAQKTDHPNYISDLTQRAAQEILRLRGQVERLRSDRQYIIGFNDGFECAKDQPSARPITDGDKPSFVIPSPQEIEEGRSPAGGWTKATLRQWGVAWPPKKGWRKELERRWEETQLRPAR